MNIEKIKIKLLYPDAKVPQYATSGSSGFDLEVNNFITAFNVHGELINVKESNWNPKKIQLPPHCRILVGCGFAVEIPIGLELQIRSRSGMSLKKGLVVLNSPGTIDSDYRGEIGAILCNTSDFVMEIAIGDKIAQAILMPILRAKFEAVNELSKTDRGMGGYGSTDNIKTVNENY